jgi:hypothetical protein
MNMKIYLAAGLAALLWAPYAGAQTPTQAQNQSAPAADKSISRSQAKTLVLAYLQSQGYKTDTAEFVLDDNPDEKDLPDYYMMDAYYNSATRVTSVGAYAVDRHSAVLWQRVSCEQVISDAVQKLQEQFRQLPGSRDFVTTGESQSSSNSPCY